MFDSFKKFFFNKKICQNLYGHSVQVFGPPKTCTDTVRSVRSGGDAHDAYNNEQTGLYERNNSHNPHH